MASHHHSLLSLAASATAFSILLLCCFTLIEALNGGFSVDLIHRDSPDSPFYNASETHSQRVAKALRRSINRVNHFKPSSSVSPIIAQTDIIYCGDYLMKYSVGTPPVEMLGYPDPGSDLIWLRCKPCPECYNQTGPFFDPKMSTTYKSVSCTSSQCGSVGNTSCSNDGTSCQYYVPYEDQSFAKGDVAVDTFTLRSTTSDNPVSLPETIIGCGHDNNGIVANGSGIVGLSRGTVSLVSQLGSSIGRKFSYCLVPSTSRVNKSSKLNFGSNAVVSGPGTVSTPLVPDSQYYRVTLEAMSVGSKRLELSGSSGSRGLEGSLEGNIVIDSGTTVTTLPTEFYSKFESAVAEEIHLERGDDPSQILSLCYKPTPDSKEIPGITAHFTGADVKLNPDTIFIRYHGLSCLAFSPVQEFFIFGNMAQSNLLVGYDLVKNTVSFKPTDCTKL